MPPKKKINKRSRRILGSRNYRNYSEEMMTLAVELVKNKSISSYDAEKQFGIPRRTIENRVKKQHSNKPGPPFRLSQDEEVKLVKVLIAAGDFGCPLSQLDFKLMVHDYLKKNNKLHVFNGKAPGDWWIKNFLERYKDKLTLRSTQNITKARAEKTLEEFEEYFDNLKVSLQNVPPQNIMNYDETNVSDDPGSTKCIFRRGVKYPERILNHSKGCISIMFAGTADGELLQPYVVYKSENLWTEWCKDGPDGARYNRTKSGWFDSVVFLDWFTNIVIPWARKLEGPKLVIGDNLSSHINPDVVELCEAHQIRFVFLPPRSTHLTQPLDVAFFGPLKKVWRNILLEYKTANPKQTSLNKSHFPILLKELIDAANLKKENMVSGFKATGIHPFNPYEVYKKLPEFEQEIKYDVDQTLLDYLKENKNPNPVQRGKNKKINVLPGKSVGSEEILVVNQKPSAKTETTLKKSKTDQKLKGKSQTKQKTSQQIPKKKRNTQRPLKRKIRDHDESSSDSESSCSIPYLDSSEYDPINDERENENFQFRLDCEEDVESKNEQEIDEIVNSTGQEKVHEILVEKKKEILDDVKENLDIEKKNEDSIDKVRHENVKDFEKPIKKQIVEKFDHEERKEVIGFQNENSSKKYKVKILSDEKITPKALKKILKSNKIEAGCSKGPEENFTCSYNINDTVLVRYIFKKKIEYFVGKINAKSENNYEVSFYKKYGRNDNLKFCKPKKKDIDTIDGKMIEKVVQLMALNEHETEFVFFDDDDLVYFD